MNNIVATISLLRKHKIAIERQKMEAYENPIADRLNGLLKSEFKLIQLPVNNSGIALSLKVLNPIITFFPMGAVILLLFGHSNHIMVTNPVRYFP